VKRTVAREGIRLIDFRGHARLAAAARGVARAVSA
jgi:hypothetical protein